MAPRAEGAWQATTAPACRRRGRCRARAPRNARKRCLSFPYLLEDANEVAAEELHDPLGAVVALEEPIDDVAQLGAAAEADQSEAIVLLPLRHLGVVPRRRPV